MSFLVLEGNMGNAFKIFRSSRVIKVTGSNTCRLLSLFFDLWEAVVVYSGGYYPHYFF
jgi:hypothetical protein